MRHRQRLAALAAGTVLAAGMGVGFAQAAFADPAGCSVHVPGFSHSATGLMTGKATASCSGSATRTLRVEIKHDESITPDVLVAANSQMKTGTSYSVSVSTCDDGVTALYYSRGFFPGKQTNHDSAHVRIHTC